MNSAHPSTGSLSCLMDGTPVAAYWLGFIFADGCFFGNRLQIALSSKDLGHLERLRDWIGYGRVSTEREGRVCRYAVLDSATVPALRARFDLKPRKTENPPSRVPFEDNELAEGNVTVLLSHFPYVGDRGQERYAQWRLKDEGLPLLHGHTHSAEEISYTPRINNGGGWPTTQMHVGLDAWNLTPVSLEQIGELLWNTF